MFRDYGNTTETTTKGNVEEAVTPIKRKGDEVGAQADFSLTPPPTVKSETVSIDLKAEITEINEKLGRRSKRQKIGGGIEDPFGKA